MSASAVAAVFALVPEADDGCEPTPGTDKISFKRSVTWLGPAGGSDSIRVDLDLPAASGPDRYQAELSGFGGTPFKIGACSAFLSVTPGFPDWGFVDAQCPAYFLSINVMLHAPFDLTKPHDLDAFKAFAVSVTQTLGS